MSKRKSTESFDNDQSTENKKSQKYSLDSDEEDSDVEKERVDVLNANDIEGEEEGVAGIEGEITITPFNMKEELEDGHFDTQGHYHWKKEKEIADAWLDNIDWVKIKSCPKDKYKVHKDVENKGLGDDSTSSEDEAESEIKVNVLNNYKEIIQHMKPKETIAKTIQRLGKTMSSAERWKRKKAGIVDEDSKTVTRITELANQILTENGNMDIYQETYEKIQSIVEKNDVKQGELDMYADDFDQKEKTSLGSKEGTSDTNSKNDYEVQETKWMFKWKQDNEEEISGPHTTEQMYKWSKEGYFKTGVWVKKQGEDCPFYSSNRIDFELYM